MPQVSVIMPVYNGEKYLAEAIDSILAQSFTDFELLIVDDGSTDGSAAIIQDYGKSDERIRILRHRKNRGMAAARNTGIAAAEGEFIASMDCDDVSLPQRLEKQVAFLRSHPEIGALGASAHVMNRELTTKIYDYEAQQQHALIALQLFLGYIFTHSTSMLRRKVLTAVGGYEPGRRTCDNLELWARLISETRIKFAGLPDCLLLYRRHDQLKFANPRVGEHEEERTIKRINLERLWGEAPESTMDRLYQLRSGTKLSWTERRAAKRDLMRLIESMIAHNWVEPEDKHLLIAEMNRRLERASPRRWQQFCHWRRHHFPRRKRT